MSVRMTVFSSKDMTSPYSVDDSYSTPIKVGSFAQPVSALVPNTSIAFPVWIKNTGTVKAHHVHVMASNGHSESTGGVADSSTPGFIELAMDNNTRLPDSQKPAPVDFIKASSSTAVAKLYLNNIVLASGQKKNITEVGLDDDARTMLPGEFSIVWIKCGVDAIRAENGTLPTVSGVRNIKLDIFHIATDSTSESSIILPGRLTVLIKLMVDISGSVYIQTMVSRWRFDEESGIFAYDSKGANHGLIFGASRWNVGIAGHSLSFNYGDRVVCGNADNLNMSNRDFSIEAWFKLPDNEHGTILSKMENGVGYMLSITPSGQVRFEATDTNGLMFYFENGIQMADTGWHYVGISLDRSTSMLKAMIDSDGPFVKPWTGVGDISCQGDFVIGGGVGVFKGRIDDVSVYNKVVSTEDMELNYDTLWNMYVEEYGITDDGELVVDSYGRIVVDEIL